MKKITTAILLAFVTITSFGQEQNQLLSIRNNLLINNELENQFQQPESQGKKSAGLAILYSMLLPGMGELYAGDYSTGKYFTIADGILWGVFSGITIYGNNKEDDYRAFAKAYGNVNLNGKDAAYFANIGIYENIDDYNREKELNRDFEEVYNTETHFWSWDGNEQRSEYRDLWTSSENAKNNVRFAVGALILNRIVSSIFAVRAVSKYNKGLQNDYAWNLNFNVEKNPTLPSRLTMNFNYNF